MVPIRRNVVLEALGLINQGSASAKPRGSAPWVIDLCFVYVYILAQTAPVSWYGFQPGFSHFPIFGVYIPETKKTRSCLWPDV